MTELAQRPDGIDRPGQSSAGDYQRLGQHPPNTGPRPGDTFNRTRDLTMERTSPLPVFYGNLAENIGSQVASARQETGSDTLGSDVMVLAQRIFERASQPAVPIPIEDGRETTTYKDEYVLHAVGDAVKKAKSTMLDPDYDGQPVLLHNAEGSSTQNLATYAEIAGILGIDVTDVNETGFRTAIPGVRVSRGEALRNDASRRMLYMTYSRDNAPQTGPSAQARHGRAEQEQPLQSQPLATPPRGRHRVPVPGEILQQDQRDVLTVTQPRFVGTEKNPVPSPAPRPNPPEKPIPVFEAGGVRGKHEFQAANQGAQIYAGLLSLAPTGPAAWPGDGHYYSRAIRDRLRRRIDEVTEHPLPQLEDDPTGEAAAQLTSALQRAVEFVDPPAPPDPLQDTVDIHDQRRGLPGFSVIFQGADTRHDHTADLVRMELIKLLGYHGHEIVVGPENREKGDKASITTVTITTEVKGIDMQIQILDGYGFDGHRRPHSSMRINLVRPRYA